MAVERVNQAWSTDSTYIRMAGGFVNLVAVMDWYSRYVLSWALSLTLELEFCLEALEAALRHGRPVAGFAVSIVRSVSSTSSAPSAWAALRIAR